MIASLRLPELKQHELTFFQRVFSAPYFWNINIAGQPWRLYLTPDRGVEGSFTLFLKVNERPVIISVNDIDPLLESFIDEHVDLSVFDEDVQIAILNTLLDEPLEQLRRMSGASCEVERFIAGNGDNDKTGYIKTGFVLENQQVKITGKLMFDPAFVDSIPAIVEHASQTEVDRWADIPLFSRVCIGETELRFGDLREISLNDFILCDRVYMEDSRVVLEIQDRIHLMCRYEGTKIVVEDIIREVNMTDETKQQDIGNPDEIPVRVTFDLGQFEISFGELKTIQPGYVFNTSITLDSPVQIRANGRLIGRGELVEVEGRIAIRVKELFEAKEA